MHRAHVQVRRWLVVVGSFLPSCGSNRSNSGSQAWWPLPIKPSWQPSWFWGRVSSQGWPLASNVVRKTLKFWSSCLCLLGAGIADLQPMPGLCSAGEPTLDLMHAMQTLLTELRSWLCIVYCDYICDQNICQKQPHAGKVHLVQGFRSFCSLWWWDRAAHICRPGNREGSAGCQVHFFWATFYSVLNPRPLEGATHIWHRSTPSQLVSFCKCPHSHTHGCPSIISQVTLKSMKLRIKMNHDTHPGEKGAPPSKPFRSQISQKSVHSSHSGWKFKWENKYLWRAHQIQILLLYVADCFQSLTV